ncbi:Ig-like domain-containing protein [Polaribacter sp.]|uniref:Ig-like domain-containing protein n=1 Tax=Polaribacter sp. TaxID=1920175 RepID=UPI003EF23F89
MLDLNYDETYFKVGNYTQSNPDEEGSDTNDPENYGEVLVYDFSVKHDEVSVSGVTLSPATLDLTLGESYQLSENISPSNASNFNVTFSSSDESIATISATGLVIGVSKGTAIITVTTVDGSFTDTSIIHVYENASGTNLAFNKTITGTGTHDADNVVANLVDGSTSTRWSVSGFPQSAIIDLGQMYSVGRTELICYNDRAYQFKISISDTENGTYTDIVDRSNNTSPGTALNPITNEFPGIIGRFIKITVSGADNYTGSWISLNEIRVYEASTLSIDSIHSEKEISIWPNPAIDSINFNNIESFQTVSIYDLIGKLIYNTSVDSKSLDISSLNPGMYILHLSNSKTIIQKRFIKK